MGRDVDMFTAGASAMEAIDSLFRGQAAFAFAFSLIALWAVKSGARK